ncbi:MAG: MotA/TolQ/ExbB proton channel family protein [Desulfobulbaceae bacterium]|nr:MotA/TolQ/ExbB proton channel family protein [Desulfobulbaceae bacterium]HIJ79320.1 flagellar motor protein PomA [Deltaproteobacteria bacterium]
MKKKNITDFATIIGLLGACGVVMSALYAGGKFSLFFNLQAFLLVVGGSSFIVLIKFNFQHFLRAALIALKTFFVKQENPQSIIDTIIDIQKNVRIHGLLTLNTDNISPPYLKQGLNYVVDNINPIIIKNTLHKEMLHTMERHQSGIKVFRALADVSPAMGMIGTLIGLMQMLSDLDDPSNIGPAMAVALLTTLYGAMMAHMFATPIADKLFLRNQEEHLLKMLITDGVLGIQQALHPYVLEEMLLAYLPGSQREGGRWKNPHPTSLGRHKKNIPHAEHLQPAQPHYAPTENEPL